MIGGLVRTSLGFVIRRVCRFMGTYDYLFGCPDSDEVDYDPSRECFHVEVEEIAPRDATPVG
jgi:hypothetical protein